MSTSTESILLSYLRHHLGHTVTRALYQKEHYLTDRSDVIFDVQKCSKIQIFQGCALDTTVEAYWESLHCSPIDLERNSLRRYPLPNNPTPILGLLIRPCFCGFRYKVLNRKYDY